jgi:ferredoxin--NADP+ reductase
MRVMSRVISAVRVNGRTSALEIHAPEVASNASGGQVVLARFDPSASWTPKAIAGVDRERETLTLLWRDAPDVVASHLAASEPAAASDSGVASRKNRRSPRHENPTSDAACPEPVEIDVTGPYGRRKPADQASKVLFLAEGLGVGALLPRIRESKESGAYTMVIAGYPSRADLFWVERLNDLSDELYVVTDDGSFGIKGPIRQTLRAICEQVADIDRVHAAGPLRLLKATADVTQSFEIPATVTLAAVFDDAVDTAAGDDALPVTAVPAETIDWENSIDVDAQSIDFESLARKLGIPLVK